MQNYIRHILLPSIVGCIIFAGTCLLKPDDVLRMPQGIPWDKIVHFGMFFVLSAVSLFHYSRLHNGKFSMKRWIFWGFVLPVMYGAIIELMQKYFFVSRSAEWGDFIADALGSITALIISLFLYDKRCKKEKKTIFAE